MEHESESATLLVVGHEILPAIRFLIQPIETHAEFAFDNRAIHVYRSSLLSPAANPQSDVRSCMVSVRHFDAGIYDSPGSSNSEYKRIGAT